MFPKRLPDPILFLENLPESGLYSWGVSQSPAAPGACSVWSGVTDSCLQPAFNSFISIRFPSPQLLSRPGAQRVRDIGMFSVLPLILEKFNLPLKWSFGNYPSVAFSQRKPCPPPYSLEDRLPGSASPRAGVWSGGNSKLFLIA